MDEFLIVLLASVVSILAVDRYNEQRKKPKIEIKDAEDGNKIGYKIIVRRKGLHHPRVMLDGEAQAIHEEGVQGTGPLEFMYVDVPYVFTPFTWVQSMSSRPDVDPIMQVSTVQVLDAQGNTVFTGEIMHDWSFGKRMFRVNSSGFIKTVRINSEELDEERVVELSFALKEEVGPSKAGQRKHSVVLSAVEPPKHKWRERLRLH